MREAQSLALYKASVEQNVRWQHLTRMKEVSFRIAFFIFLAKEKREQAISGTSAATYMVMNPH